MAKIDVTNETDTSDAPDNGYPKRKSPRLCGHDYSGGVYFVTICTDEKKHYFGNISDGEMHFTRIGEYCHGQLENLSEHYRYVSVALHVVMPNHIHMIVAIDSEKDNGTPFPDERTLLSVVIGGLKRSVTMYARKNNIEFGWQSRYHDHIIRGTKDGNKITEYIKNNVALWDSDCFHT